MRHIIELNSSSDRGSSRCFDEDQMRELRDVGPRWRILATLFYEPSTRTR